MRRDKSSVSDILVTFIPCRLKYSNAHKRRVANLGDDTSLQFRHDVQFIILTGSYEKGGQYSFKQVMILDLKYHFPFSSQYLPPHRNDQSYLWSYQIDHQFNWVH